MGFSAYPAQGQNPLAYKGSMALKKAGDELQEGASEAIKLPGQIPVAQNSDGQVEMLSQQWDMLTGAIGEMTDTTIGTQIDVKGA